MLKVLIVQENGRHEENRLFRECYAIKEAFTRNGIQSEIWGKGHDNFEYPPDFNSFDFIFNLEQYSPEWLPEMSLCKALKIYWAIDIHVRGLQEYWKICKNYNVILHSTYEFMGPLRNIIPTAKHYWFPNGVDERFFFHKDVVKTRDLIFVGTNLPERKQIIEHVEQNCKMKCYYVLGTDMIDYIRSTKIHFNKNLSCDINYRTFETIGLGTCLLTNNNPHLKELGFIHNKNCLIYDDLCDIVPIVNECLRNNTWKEIGLNGYELSKQHTYTKRIAKLLEDLR